MSSAVKKSPPESAVEELSVDERRRQYNCAVREARLVSIEMRSLNFSVDPKFYPELLTEQDVQWNFGPKLLAFTFFEEAKAIACVIRWSANITQGRKKLVKCHADYYIGYDGFSGSNTEVLKVFAESVGVPATYSYFRALYAQLDWSAGVQSPPLPIYRVFPKV